MTNQKPSFRSSLIDFATAFLIAVISGFIAGYVVGTLGGPREPAIAGGVGAMMAFLWVQKQRKARKSGRRA
jgi:L-lactate permease